MIGTRTFPLFLFSYSVVFFLPLPLGKTTRPQQEKQDFAFTISSNLTQFIFSFFLSFAQKKLETLDLETLAGIKRNLHSHAQNQIYEAREEKQFVMQYERRGEISPSPAWLKWDCAPAEVNLKETNDSAWESKSRKGGWDKTISLRSRNKRSLKIAVVNKRQKWVATRE